MKYAWLMVAVCTAMVAMAFGVIGTVAVFLEPLAAEFGWPRADVSAAYSVATIATGFGGIAMGYFADRMPVFDRAESRHWRHRPQCLKRANTDVIIRSRRSTSVPDK